MVSYGMYGIVWYRMIRVYGVASVELSSMSLLYFGCLYVLHDDASDADCWVLLDLV